MKVIISENKLPVIKENIEEELKLPKFVYNAVKLRNTSLGDNGAIPPIGEFGYEYKILKERLKEVTDNLRDNGFEPNDTDYLMSVLSKLVKKAVEMEKPIKRHLEKICKKIVFKMFSVPYETIIFRCELVGKVSPSHSIRVMPEDDADTSTMYSFEDIAEMMSTEKSVAKRRFIDALIQGASYEYSDASFYENEISNVNNELLPLYKKINAINDYLIFVKKEKISDKNPMQNAYVEVHLGHGSNKTKIKSQAILFPFLLRETIRGFFELFSSHGLPDDNNQAQYIVRKADFMAAEPWDLRLGVIMYRSISNVIRDTRIVPYAFADICREETDEFNELMQNILAGTNKGIRYLEYSMHNIMHDREYQQFKDKIQQKNADMSIITDGYMTADELDNFVIDETAV